VCLHFVCEGRVEKPQLFRLYREKVFGVGESVSFLSTYLYGWVYHMCMCRKGVCTTNLQNWSTRKWISLLANVWASKQNKCLQARRVEAERKKEWKEKKRRKDFQNELFRVKDEQKCSSIHYLYLSHMTDLSCIRVDVQE